MSKPGKVGPRTLSTPRARAARLTLLSQPHIKPLRSLVERIRNAKESGFDVPDFDPLDGGIDAQVLFVLEAPGPRAVASGFVSRDNPDGTASNFFLLNEAAGIDRRATIIWNAVPWYIGSGQRIRPATRADVSEGAPWLTELLGLLHRLRIVVFVGRKALHARPLVVAARPDVELFEMPHPSPMFINRAPGNRQRVLMALREVAERLQQLGRQGGDCCRHEQPGTAGNPEGL